MPPAKRLLVFGFFAWSAYVAGRTLIQHSIPVYGWPSYLRQDLSITVLRLACGLGVLWLATRRWSLETLGLARLHLGSAWAWASCGLLLLSSVLSILSHPLRFDPNAGFLVRGTETAVALVVAFNEEIGFRGLFYRSLRETWAPWAGIWIPSLFFSAMHYGYQPGFHLLEIFLIGATFAVLREQGASLSALILIHFSYDALYALASPPDGFVAGPYYASIGCAGLALLAALKAPARRAWPENSPLLFAYGTLKRGQAAAKELNMEGRAQYLGPAGLQGQLYDLGEYPGLRSTKKAGALVQGELYALSDPGLLHDLDAYEGEEFLRDRVDLDTKGQAWAYFLRKLPRGAKRLGSRAW